MGFLTRFISKDLQSTGWNDPQHWVPIAGKFARDNGLDPELVVALILHESRGDPLAARSEDGFYARYISGRSNTRLRGRWPHPSLGKLAETLERNCRAVSFGLMQIMLQTAREFGYNGEFPWGLFEPATNIEFGCKKLKMCFDLSKAKHSNKDEIIWAALLYWNGGGNPQYPALVLKYVTNKRAKELLKYDV